MAIATFHFLPLPGETNRAPAGGCWIQGVPPSDREIKSFAGGQAAGQQPNKVPAPPTYYPEGYWLPAGTTQYAVLYSLTNQERIIEYVPWQYSPQAVANLVAIQTANRARVPGLLEAGILQPDEVENYVRTRGLTAAQLRRLDRLQENGRRPGEIYVGRPAMVIFNIGTRALTRRTMVQQLWEDIELALGGS